MAVSYPGGGFTNSYGVISNPPMPYTGDIGHVLQDGEMIVIQGYIPPHANRFSINLQSGAFSGADIALHFNPRFEENQVVRNTFRGSWGAEERHNGMPLAKGQSFEIIILVQYDVFKIAVNGKHFAEYSHRMPKESIRSLGIDGDVTIQTMRYQPPANQLPPAPPAYAAVFNDPYNPMPAQPAPLPPGYDLKTPYSTKIPGGIRANMMIFISGIPLAGADRFQIDIAERGKNIAFHFNPRMNEQTVVRNSLIGGIWGIEERYQPHFPFYQNMKFDIIILCEANNFKVAVNNQHFIEYPYRLRNFSAINQLRIGGGVQLTNVRVQ